MRREDWHEALAEADEVARAETARMSLCDRLKAASGLEVSVSLHDGTTIRGRIEMLVEAFLILSEPCEAFWMVPVGGVGAIAGLPARTEAEAGDGGSFTPRQGSSLGRLLRTAQGKGAEVVVHTPHGRYAGRLDAVARDHMDLALPAPAPKVAVPWAGVSAIRVGITWD